MFSKVLTVFIISLTVFVSSNFVAQAAFSPAFLEEKGGVTYTEADYPRISVDELKTKLAKGEEVIIIDVRGKDFDASATKIKGALRFNGDLKTAAASLPKDKEIVTYCACSTDGGSVKAAMMLREAGFTNVRALKGGWTAWNAAQGAIENK
jgi:rhodanese-related sulfurtransferase